MSNENCMMDFNPTGKHEWEKDCLGGNRCKRCGWNVRVHAERVKRIRSGGLKQDENGLWYLPVATGDEPTANNSLANLALTLYCDV